MLILSKACFCSSVKGKGLSLFISLFLKGFLSIFCSIISTYPFFSNVLITALETSIIPSKSALYMPSFSSKKRKTLICFAFFSLPSSISSSISSSSFFKYTKLAVLSLILFSKFVVFSPGGSINFIHSEILQKYLLAIIRASSTFSSVKGKSSIFIISLFANSEFSLKPITNPSICEFLGPKGTKTLAPIFMKLSICSGTR